LSQPRPRSRPPRTFNSRYLSPRPCGAGLPPSSSLFSFPLPPPFFGQSARAPPLAPSSLPPERRCPAPRSARPTTIRLRKKKEKSGHSFATRDGHGLKDPFPAPHHRACWWRTPSARPRSRRTTRRPPPVMQWGRPPCGSPADSCSPFPPTTTPQPWYPDPRGPWFLGLPRRLPAMGTARLT